MLSFAVRKENSDQQHVNIAEYKSVKNFIIILKIEEDNAHLLQYLKYL